MSASRVFAPGHLDELTANVPFEMVADVLARVGGLQERVRLLPSRAVVYLLLAGAFFEPLGWGQVWARLTTSLPGDHPVPAASAISEAMRRVGPRALEELFDVAKGAAATTARQAAWFAGRLVVAIDGT